jgi:type III secretion system FlhB-like substrate exporter
MKKKSTLNGILLEYSDSFQEAPLIIRKSDSNDIRLLRREALKSGIPIYQDEEALCLIEDSKLFENIPPESYFAVAKHLIK